MGKSMGLEKKDEIFIFFFCNYKEKEENLQENYKKYNNS